MSEGNQTDGLSFYASCDMEAREWFARQWRIWPKRADEANTTNISFLYGGVLAYREEHGRDPDMSADYRSHVAYLDRCATPPKPDRLNGEGA